MLIKTVLTFSLLAGAVWAQKWEFGAIGGAGFSPDVTLQSAAGSAATGLKTGPVAGVYVGADSASHWGGEIRYLYRWSDLKLSSGNTKVDFAGHTHILHFDFLGYLQPEGTRVRVFGAFGAGIKVLTGTGQESAAQPLANFAALTATRENLPVGDAGAGVKFDINPHARMRFEIRDYISPTPSKVIAAAPGVTIGGVLNDIQALASIAYTW